MEQEKKRGNVSSKITIDYKNVLPNPPENDSEHTKKEISAPILHYKKFKCRSNKVCYFHRRRSFKCIFAAFEHVQHTKRVCNQRN